MEVVCDTRHNFIQTRGSLIHVSPWRLFKPSSQPALCTKFFFHSLVIVGHQGGIYPITRNLYPEHRNPEHRNSENRNPENRNPENRNPENQNPENL